MEGWGWTAVHDPEVLPSVMERWQESIAAGNRFDMEFPLRRHDGVFRWFITRVVPIRSESGAVERWVGINTDIHERRQANMAAERLYSSVLENMAEGVCVVRVSDELIIHTNQKFDTMLGYETGVLLGTPILRLSEGDRNFTSLGAVSLHQSQNYEVLRARADGSSVWLKIHTSNLDHPAFGLLQVLACEDITRRKAIEEERDGFFELSLEMLGIASFDGFFKRLNPEWEQTLGWSRQELTAKPWLDFVHPDDRDATIRAGAGLEAGAKLIAFVNRYVHKDGGYRWLQWKCMPVPERRIIYAVARDITAGLDNERKLEELSQSLVTTVNSIADGVIATDVSGAVSRMNPVAEKLTGWNVDEARVKPIEGIFNVNPLRAA